MENKFNLYQRLITDAFINAVSKLNDPNNKEKPSDIYNELYCVYNCYLNNIESFKFTKRIKFG